MIITTDGMLTAEVSADLATYKMQFLNDWLFVFAGTLGNADLIMEEIRHEAATTSDKLSREKIQSTLRRAYKGRQSQWAADRNLAPYDIEMEEFKKNGLKIFGDKIFADLDYSIRQDVPNFNEQVIVTGWGKSDMAAMIYICNAEGGQSRSLDGFAAIGSGTNVATTTLMLLGCARHLPFEYALYAVAAAKFSAESCEGVGKTTAMVVTHKRKSGDDPKRAAFHIIQPSKIEELRTLWETYSKPKIPDEAIRPLCHMAQSILGQVTPSVAIRAMQIDSFKMKERRGKDQADSAKSKD